MKALLFRADCPDSLQLGEYELGLIASAQAATLAHHLETCPHCQAELTTLRDFQKREAIRPEAAPAPGPWTAFPSLRELVARLIPRTAAPALRGEVREQIMAEAEGVMVILDVRAGKTERLAVFGQIAADEQERWAEAVVQFRREGRLEAVAMVDDLGAFRCETLTPGAFDLRLSPLSGPVVVVPNIALQA
jgi:anti-sigma factor RsiW